MHRVLSIENIAVAKEVELELEKGFSVLTGETGAGKSILLDGLSLVLGERINEGYDTTRRRPGRASGLYSRLRTAI